MRISIDFQPRRPPLLPALLAAAAFTALAGVAAAGWMVYDVVGSRAEMPALKKRLAILERQTREIRVGDELPDERTLNDLRRRVAALNRYSVAGGWSAPTLLAWLERQLPDDVYLAGLQQNLELGTVKLTAESVDPGALTAMLARLEKEPHFREVLLVRQGPRAGRADRMQFVVELKERR
jgi:hypothetical protein